MPAIRDCVTTYLAEVTPNKAKTTQRHDHYYARILCAGLTDESGDELIVEPIADLDVASFGPPEVDALHVQLGQDAGHPTLANRVLSFVSQVCCLAERRRLAGGEQQPHHRDQAIPRGKADAVSPRPAAGGVDQGIA